MHQTRRILVVLSLCAMALTLMPTSVHALTGADLLKQCRNYQAREDKNLCNLYVSSLVKFVTSPDKLSNPRGKLCIGADVPVAEVAGAIAAWLDKNPALLAKDGYEAAYGGLAGKYRCR